MEILMMMVMLIIAFFVAFLIVVPRFVQVPPNRALIVFGRKTGQGKGYRILTSGGTIIWPFIESYDWLNVEVRTLDINLHDVVTKEKILLEIEAVAQVQIDKTPEALETAAMMLMGREQDEIDYIAQRWLEGHVRGICANLTVEQINADRYQVSSSIQDVAVKDLKNVGLNVVSFTIRDLMDKEGDNRLLVESIRMVDRHIRSKGPTGQDGFMDMLEKAGTKKEDIERIEKIIQPPVENP